MSRWFGLVGIGLLAALVAFVLMRPGPAVSEAERADALAASLRCPDCQGLSVADSHTASATEIRRQIDAMVAAGATDDEVRDHFVARYGEWMLLAPSGLLPWLVPIAVVLAAVALLATWLWRRSEPPTPAPTPPDADRRRVHDEAEALDA